MKKLVCLLFVATALLAKDNSLSKPQAAEGWVLLFDGETTFGWTQASGAQWSVANGALAPVTDNGFIRTNTAFSDFILDLDYRASAPDADCTISLRATLDGDPKDSSYQLQIGDNKSDWPTGSIVDHFKADAVHPAPNGWHSLEATFSGDHILTKIEGKPLVDGKDARGKAGYIELACTKGGKVQFRNIRLKPIEMKALFNGTDLAGWKAVGPPPPKKAGMLKKMTGGGGGKVKEAEWSVVNGLVHGQDGTGQLETTATYDDFLLQVAVRVNAHDKNDHPRSAIFFRGDPGQLFSGYEASVLNLYRNGDHNQSYADSTGALQDLASARKILGTDNEFFTETIAARGRHVQIWVDGYPVSDFQDTRAEGNAPAKDARTAAGAIALQSPGEKANLDFRNIQIAQLPKNLGKGPVPPPPPPVVATPAAPVTPSSPIIQMPAPAPDPNKPKVQQLMAQALATNDPQQQANLYTQILLLDPGNQVAFNGRQQAQQKIDEAQAKQQQEQKQEQQVSQSESEKLAKGNAAKQKAEEAFLAGDLKTAHTQIGVADKLLTTDQGVQQLKARIEAAIQARNRLRMLWGGAGVIALLGLITLFFATRGKKEPYLEVIQGLDKGKRFNLDQEVIHIGAVAEDGGSKNEIVLRDVERMISRFHCEIHQQRGRLFLIDCDSANGTKVDSKTAQAGKPVRLKSGARVDLAGTCVLKLGAERRKKN